MSYLMVGLSKKTRLFTLIPIGLLVACFSAVLQADSLSKTDEFMEQYFRLQLSLDTDEKREEPLAHLLEQAELYRDANPTNAEAWLATARIRFGYGDTQGITRMIGMFKLSRKDLEKAISLDEKTKEGLAKSFLGYLYFGLPRWPLSFGNRKKGEKLLAEALDINSTNLANNYFYGMYLVATKKYQLAEEHLHLAKTDAESGESRSYLQTYHLREIESYLQEIDKRK